MKNFLQEYWLYILIPFAVLIVVFAALWIMAGGGSLSEFTYQVF